MAPAGRAGRRSEDFPRRSATEKVPCPPAPAQCRARRPRSAGMPPIGAPSNTIASGRVRNSPAMLLSSALLPAPLAPITATASPRADVHGDAEQRLEIAVEGIERARRGAAPGLAGIRHRPRSPCRSPPLAGSAMTVCRIAVGDEGAVVAGRAADRCWRASACTTCSIQTIETPLCAHLADQLDQRVTFALGQPAGDFIEQQHRGIGGERAGEFEPLAVEQRQTARRPIGFVGKSAAFENVHAARIGVVLAAAAAERRGDDEIFEHAHAAERQRNLKRPPDAHGAAPRRRHAGNVGAGIEHAAGIRRHGAADDAEQSRLAGAVRADDAERLAFCESEVDGVGDDDGAEPFARFCRGRGSAQRPASFGRVAALWRVLFSVLDRRPDGVRRCRHRHVAHADTRASASRMALVTAAGAAVVPPSPPALMPSGLVGDSTSAIPVSNDGSIVGMRHAVIHQRAGQRLAGIRIEIDLLADRLADALRDRAVGLAMHDQGIDAAADVVDRGVARDRHRAGVGIDLDFADARCRWETPVRASRCR